MEWFGGAVQRDHRAHPLPVPTAATIIRSGNAMLWVAGSSLAPRIVGDHRRWVAALGGYPGTDNDLHHLAEVHRRHSVFTVPGAYTVVISDGDSVWVSVDIAGTRPIYYADIEHGMVWASRARDLATLLQRQVDPTWLAGHLYTPDVDPAITGRCAFTGITMAQPGQWLHLTAEHATTIPAWTPTRRTRAEATRRLATALTEGVVARLKGATVTADCSGGLDSTTLTMLAHQHATTTDQVTAVTFHPRGVVTGGDLDYVRDLLTARPQLPHQWLPLDDAQLPFADMEGVPTSDEPAPMTAGYARMTTQFTTLRDLDSSVHLTGDGGDTLLCAPLLYLADLLGHGRYRDVYRHALGWARVRRVSPWPLLRGAVMATRHTHTASFAQLAHTIHHTHPSSIVDNIDGLSATWHDHTMPPWITDTGRHHAAALLTAVAHQHADTPAGLDRAGQLMLAALRTVGRTATADTQIAEHHGISLHNPYLDPAVVDAVLSVPAWHWATPHRYKPLLTEAFPTLLPSSIANRSTKGSYELDHYRGIRAHTGVLHELVDGELAALDLIQPDPLHEAIDLAAAGVPVNITGIERVATTETWLRAIRSAPATRWNGHEHQHGDPS